MAIAGAQMGMNANANAKAMDVEECDGRSGDLVMRMLRMCNGIGEQDGWEVTDTERWNGGRGGALGEGAEWTSGLRLAAAGCMETGGASWYAGTLVASHAERQGHMRTSRRAGNPGLAGLSRARRRVRRATGLGVQGDHHQAAASVSVDAVDAARYRPVQPIAACARETYMHCIHSHERRDHQEYLGA